MTKNIISLIAIAVIGTSTAMAKTNVIVDRNAHMVAPTTTIVTTTTQTIKPNGTKVVTTTTTKTVTTGTKVVNVKPQPKNHKHTCNHKHSRGTCKACKNTPHRK